MLKKLGGTNMGKKYESLEPAIYDKNKTIWYFKDININYSFTTLENMGKQKGAKFEVGDIVVADNAKRTRRKVFKKTLNAYLILYVGLLGDNIFTPLTDGKNCKIDGKGKAMAQNLTYEYIQD